jgi:bifunctional pyridoxal-dependent enzyme with beta-cystathionase and maltose regulon repressor activities
MLHPFWENLRILSWNVLYESKWTAFGVIPPMSNLIQICSRVTGAGDTTSPLYAHFMHFMQSVHKSVMYAL